MSNTQWYIEREGVEYGPCNWDGLQALAREGTLRMTDLVRRDGDTYFVPAHQARCDGPARPAADAAQAAAQPAPVTVRKQISELVGPAAVAQVVAAARAAEVANGLESGEADLDLALAEPQVAETTTTTTTPAMTTPPFLTLARLAPAEVKAEPVQVERAATVETIAVKPAVTARKTRLKTAAPAETIVELELDEEFAPVAKPQPAAPVNFTGPAVLALVCAVGGLFWFGLLLGFISVVLAVNALRAMGRNGGLAPRGVAMAALMLGAADLIVLVSALASHARLATVFWN